MKCSLFAKALLAFCFLQMIGAFAQNADDFGDAFPDDATTVDFDLAAWWDVAGHHFQLEQTPLAEVIRALGGQLQRTGKAGSANFDYFASYTDGLRLITFSSNNDMGGPEHAVQGVAIRKLSPLDNSRGLQHLKLPIVFPFGSSDVSFPALTHKMGHAIGHQGVFAYTFSTKYKAHDSSGHSWMVGSYAYLEVRVRKNKIVAMSVDHSSESE